jgi:hypothetical protein
MLRRSRLRTRPPARARAGLLTSVQFGLAYVTGALLGGFIMTTYGGRALWRVGAAMALAGAALMGLSMMRDARRRQAARDAAAAAAVVAAAGDTAAAVAATAAVAAAAAAPPIGDATPAATAAAAPKPASVPAPAHDAAAAAAAVQDWR